MKIINKVEDIKEIVKDVKCLNKTIGLVPTMGFLHEGHLSLIKKARDENDFVVVSIFVNPTQFGPNEDFDNYPKDLKNDFKKCEEAGVDLVFNPFEDQMYNNHKTYITVDDLSNQLCGLSRPIHFRGVCTVVAKLFNISKADKAYFGQKDAQQLMIIKKMVKDLNFDIEIIGCPIIREKDGLAKSSRNKYLDEKQRKDATILYKAISKAKEIIKKGMDSKALIDEIRNVINEVSYAEIDYIEVVDLELLQPVKNIDDDVLIALAVKIGPARLIDNFVYKVKDK